MNTVEDRNAAIEVTKREKATADPGSVGSPMSGVREQSCWCALLNSFAGRRRNPREGRRTSQGWRPYRDVSVVK